jgi:hypothetical protein
MSQKIENLYRKISCTAHKIFYIALSKTSDEDRYVIIRKLLDSIFKEKNPYGGYLVEHIRLLFYMAAYDVVSEIF